MTTAKYTSKLLGQRVFVLGGTSGIGFCVAEAALEQGAFITIASSTPKKLESAVARLQESYPEYKDRITSVRCDLADTLAIDGNVETALKHAARDGPVDHIVVTATPPLPILDLAQITVDHIHAASDPRIVTALMLAKHGLTYLKRDARSSLTLTTGVIIDKPPKEYAIMAGLFSAINGLAPALAVAMAPIRVNAVSPGATRTELTENLPEGEGYLENERRRTLTGTVAGPGDTAEAYLFCIKNPFVTGDVVRTNGGNLLV